MEHPGFFNKAGPFGLSKIAEAADAELSDGLNSDLQISDVKPLDLAGPNDISFLDNKKYLPLLETTRAGACFVLSKFIERVPDGSIAMVAPAPYRSFAKALALFYPEANWSKSADFSAEDFSGLVHPSVELEEDVIVEPGAVIGPRGAYWTGPPAFVRGRSLATAQWSAAIVTLDHQ